MGRCGCKKFPHACDDPDYFMAARKRTLLQLREKKALSRVERSPYSPAMRNILLIILILLLIGAFPGWGYSTGWGYYPFGGIGLVLLIVLILALTGKL
jgi:hypothetical protein